MYISDNAELAENKLTILYISKVIGLPLTNMRLSQIVSEGKLFNFFLLQHLLEDLLANKYLAKAETPAGEITYLITVKGSDTLNFLIHKLPKGIRRHIDRLTENKADIIRNDRDIVTYIEPVNNNGFISTLQIKDGDALLFSIQYASGSKNDAIAICDEFKDNAEKIYNIITNNIIA